VMGAGRRGSRFELNLDTCREWKLDWKNKGRQAKKKRPQPKDAASERACGGIKWGDGEGGKDSKKIPTIRMQNLHGEQIEGHG